MLGGGGGPPASLPDVAVSDLDPERVVAVKLDPGLVRAQPVEPANLLRPELDNLHTVKYSTGVQNRLLHTSSCCRILFWLGEPGPGPGTMYGIAPGPEREKLTSA